MQQGDKGQNCLVAGGYFLKFGKEMFPVTEEFEKTFPTFQRGGGTGVSGGPFGRDFFLNQGKIPR